MKMYEPEKTTFSHESILAIRHCATDNINELFVSHLISAIKKIPENTLEYRWENLFLNFTEGFPEN